ncbi:hypothetical protein [Siphonobacter curvatus]|uniref:Glycosyltransferase 2-like domain-containing protein n=1 Tax=Siphonobacter curvatus TaxID=2094562 RepID=A0A2S7IER9_9BACT|nr:hypothetical protein [Siphonobacter curvatus]PQA52729.1 hypothetical protein C5O19_25685 [Siphonobacter curvatus]
MGQGDKKTNLLIKVPRKIVSNLRNEVNRFIQYFHEVKLNLQNKYSRKQLDSKSDNIVVSVTCYPARISTLHLTLETIFNQNLTPDVIHLWLSLEEFPNQVLPSQIVKLQERGLKVTFVSENIRSYKKLIYALKAYPNSTIITIDDDILYPKYWLREMINCHNKYPLDVLCYRGHDIILESEKKIIPYNRMINNISKYGHNSSYNIMPTGVSGVLYPPNSLHKEVFEISKFLKLAPHADDIWFKCCSLLNNVKCRRVKGENVHFLTIRSTQKDSLYNINVLLNRNDEQMKNLFDEYNLYDMIKN